MNNLNKKITLEDYNNKIDDIEILTQEIELSSDNLDEFVDIILDTYKPKIEGGQIDREKLISDKIDDDLKKMKLKDNLKAERLLGNTNKIAKETQAQLKSVEDSEDISADISEVTNIANDMQDILDKANTDIRSLKIKKNQIDGLLDLKRMEDNKVKQLTQQIALLKDTKDELEENRRENLSDAKDELQDDIEKIDDTIQENTKEINSIQQENFRWC